MDNSIPGKLAQGAWNAAVYTARVLAIGGTLGTTAYFIGDHFIKEWTAGDCDTETTQRYLKNSEGSSDQRALVTLGDQTLCWVDLKP